jgi:hypothetical protein
MNTETIKQELQRLITPSKLHKDFWSMDWYGGTEQFLEGTFRADLTDSELQEGADPVILVTDEIHILAIDCLWRIDYVFEVKVVIGFGVMIPSTRLNGVFSIQRCLCKMHYNDDLSLYDCEFFMESYYRWKGGKR